MSLNAERYVAGLMERARRAQKVIENFTQQEVDRIVKAVAWSAVREDNSTKISRLAADESGLGYYEAKYIKLQKKVRGALRDINGVKSTGIIERDRLRGLVKIAKPAGVIGAILPCTNPEATPVIKAIFALKGRNAVIFSPHPRTKGTNKLIVDVMRNALADLGVPEDLLVTVEKPTLDISNEVMRQSDLIVATGGGPMVKSAYGSGTPAYGVGTGNTVVVVDETADIEEAAHKIMLSKTFDYGTSCSSENSLIIQKRIYAELIAQLQKEGGYLADEKEKEHLCSVMWNEGYLNKDIIAQPAALIAEKAGISVTSDTSFIMVQETGTGSDYPFSGEKLSVVLTLYEYDDFDEAIAMVNKITEYQGKGHSCGIHSNNNEHIERLGKETKVSRIMVRQPQCYGNSGNWDNGMPFTMTLGCGTWGGNISSENITWKHMINTTWVSYPVEEIIPDDKELFGEAMEI